MHTILVNSSGVVWGRKKTGLVVNTQSPIPHPMLTTGAKRLLVIQAVMNMAMAIAGMFSLIYLVDRGFSYQESLLYLVTGILTTVVLTVALSNRGWMNSRKSIFASNLFMAASYGSFLVLDGYSLLIIPGFLYGLHITFFWIPFNILLLRHTESQNRGFTLGISFFIFPLISVIMPVLGGSIIENMDFNLVFLIATCILLANAVLVAMSGNLPGGIIKLRLKSMRARIWKAFFFEGMHEGVYFFASPLLTYHFAGGEFMTGIMFSFFALIGTLASVFIARVSDRKGKRLIFAKIGAIGAIPGMIIAGLADTTTVFLIGMAIFNFFIPMVWIFLMTRAGDMKRKGDSMLTREFCLNSGRVVTLAASIFLIPLLGIGPLLALSSIFMLGVLAAR